MSQMLECKYINIIIMMISRRTGSCGYKNRVLPTPLLAVLLRVVTNIMRSRLLLFTVTVFLWAQGRGELTAEHTPRAE